MNPLAVPAGTRALARGRIVRALVEAQADALIDWNDVHQNLGALTNWNDQLFLVYQYIEDWHELDAYGGWDFIPYLIDWTGIGVRGHLCEMPDPFESYTAAAEEFTDKLGGYLRP